MLNSAKPITIIHSQMLAFLCFMALYCSTAFAQQVVISGQTATSGQVNIGGPAGPTIVIPQPVIVSPAALPSATQNTAYSYTLQGSNGTPPYTWTVSVGSLPTGLTLSTAGVISGTPTGTGTSTFTVLLTDSKSQTASQQFQLIVLAAALPLTITQTSIPSGTVNTAYSQTLTATGGTGTGYSFSLASGVWPTGITMSSGGVISGTPTQAGNFAVTVQVTDSGANTAHQNFTLTINNQVVSSGADNRYATGNDVCTGLPADGPVTTIMTKCYYTPLSATPSPGTVRTTTAANLLSTYTAASCGDVIKVTGGTSNTGPITLTGKGCDNLHWITIEGSGVTSDVNFPAEGTRTSPCFSNVTSLANYPSYPCSSPAADTAQFVATSSNSAILLKGADHIRFIGIEFTRVTTPGALIFSIIDMSNGTTQTNNIIFDRVWIHGVNATNFPQTPATDTSTTRGVYLGQSNHVAIIDSYMSDFYDNGSTASNGNTDAQCVGGGFGGISNSGWGVYKFVNNHCSAGSEGFILGGANGPPNTPTGCTFGSTCNLDVPQNIEVRRNFFFAPLNWNGNTTSIVSTGYPNRKNGVEFKTGANILLEANVMKNCWYSSQPYCYGFDFAPKNQSNGAGSPTCPSCLVQDFVSRDNYVYNYVGIQIAIYSTPDSGCGTCTTLGRRGSVHDNLVGDSLNLGSISPSGADGIEFLADAGPMTQISIRHNTNIASIRSSILWGSLTAGTSTSGMNQIIFQDNLMFSPNNGSNGWHTWLAGNGSLSGYCDLVTQTITTFLNTCINGTTATWTVDHNAFFFPGSISFSGWPSGNLTTTSISTVGFTTVPGNNSAGFPDSGMNPGDWILTAGSAFHNAASDGSDIGANITQLQSEISGVSSY